jgi:phytol kinase
LRDGVGTVLTGVSRPSLGEICFPIAVALLWLLSRGDKLLFAVPMLILTLADTVAALVGIVYGKVHYLTSEGFKSAEGSLAFFSIAFLSVHVPLLLFTDVGRAQTLLIGAILGILSTLIEAIAARGLDNLLIPLGTFAFLKLYEHATPHALVIRLAATFILLVFVLSWRRRTTLDDSALMACALFGYGAAMLGGWKWLIGPLILFVAHVVFSPRKGQRRVHTVYAVVSVTLAGLFWLGLQVAYGGIVRFYFPYAIGFGADLAIIGVSQIGTDPSPMPPWIRLGRSIMMGWALVILQMVPMLLRSMKLMPVTETTVIAGIVCVATGATSFYLLVPWLYGKKGSDIAIHSVRFASSSFASLLAMPMQLIIFPATS